MGLKLIANVTYGYTSANFSGRMPCIEVADSIVSKARQTLERAIQLVHNTHKWNAQVVYGDTDRYVCTFACSWADIDMDFGNGKKLNTSYEIKLIKRRLLIKQIDETGLRHILIKFNN